MFRKIVLCIMFMILAFSVYSYQVDVDQSQQAAAIFLSSRNPAAAISSHFSVQDTGKDLFYVFNIEPAGYVILSSNTDIAPVIAYSFQGRSIKEKSFDPEFKAMLTSDLRNRSRYYRDFPDESSRNAAEWESLLSNRINRERPQYWPPQGSTETGGWVETTWHQGYPYNNFCPLDPSTNYRSITGCVATAMSQIIDYHSYIGEVNFGDTDGYITNGINIDDDSDIYGFPDFEQLNAYLDEVNYKYTNSIPLEDDDLAALNFAAGVSLKMYYSSEVSWAYFRDVAYNLRRKFGYESAVNINYAFPSFYNHLINNMINALPVELSIYNPGWDNGHAIVCDGYNTDDFFHLNFGWGENNPDEITESWYLLPEGMPSNYSIVYEGEMYIDPDTFHPYVWWEPENIVPGDVITIYYGECGQLFGAEQISIHHGIDGWYMPETTEMEFNEMENRWEIEIPIDESVYILDFCFNDGNLWDNNSQYDWHIQFNEINIPYIMDGELDAPAQLVLSSENLDLWADVTAGYIYLASRAASDSSDIFIYLCCTDDPIMVPAPWWKSGSVCQWDWLLTDEGSTPFSGWFDINEDFQSPGITIDNASGEVLEGFLHIPSKIGDHDSIFVAVVEYETQDYGEPMYQLPLGNGDIHIDLSEFTVFPLVNLDSDQNILSMPEVKLHQNYRNPFNPVTSISFSLPVSSRVEVEIFNCKGQKVSSLINEVLDRGDHEISWDGRDNFQKAAGSGLYFYSLKADGILIDVKKCLLLK